MRLLICITKPFIVRSLMKGQLAWLAKKDIEVTVLTSEGGDVDWIRSQGVYCDTINFSRNPSLYSDIKSLILTANYLLRKKFDIIHYSTPKISFIVSIILFFSKNKCKSVFTHRGRVYENYSLVKKIYEAIDVFSCKVADLSIFISSEIRDEFLLKDFVQKENSCLLLNGSSNGFDTNYYRLPTKNDIQFAKKFFGINPYKRVFCFLGRVSYDKGILDLINVFEKLHSSYPDSVLLIVGRDEIGIHELIDKHIFKDSIIYKDWLPDTNFVYWASNLLLFPSYREGFGNVCVESILSGTPVIAYNIIGCRESVNNGISGILVDYKNDKEFLLKTIELLEDEKRYAQMVKNGRIWALENFDQSMVWNYILSLYNKLST